MMSDESRSSDESTNPVGDTEPYCCQPGHSRVVAAIYILGAVMSLSLGAIGFVMPVLPGTPFVLLGSMLLLKGSPRLHRQMKQTRLFGRILHDWEERGGIRTKDRIRAVSVVVIGSLFTFVFGPQSTSIRLLALFFVALGLTVILRLPSARD